MERTVFPGYAVAHSAGEIRSAYLRQVMWRTMLGLFISGIVGFASAFALALVPSLLGGLGPMLIILGCWAVTNFVARPMVFGTAKWGGFLLGTVTQGVSLGFLLLVAMILSKQEMGNPFSMIGTALTMTLLVGLGLTIYTYSERREFSMLRAGLSVLFLPMLVLMGISFAFPSLLQGTFGIVVSGLFVVISAAGLLYQLNAVLHDFTPDMEMEGAFVITIGVLVLFWNILTLLMRLRRR